MIGLAPRLGALALRVIKDQQVEFGPRRKPVDDFEPGGAGRAVDEDCCGHAPDSAASGT